MAYVIGIDTGGTYTDAVLMDTDKTGPESIIRKTKAFTTHEELEIGIEESLINLNLSNEIKALIERVVISTTLATNATVEGKIHKVGAIVIGRKPRGKLATEDLRVVRGEVSIKGRVILDIDKREIEIAVKSLLPKVDSIAVSGVASVRNPELEMKVKSIINDMCDLPVVCGHQLASDLGFLERTNTAIVNAGLFPIIAGFIRAIKSVLIRQKIEASVFIVRGDGSIVKIEVIKDTPVETVLSGPAASIIGATKLTKLENSIVSDMGGTTTDVGIVKNNRVELSHEGANVGDLLLRIKSAKLYTFALGGDSNINVIDGEFKVGPERVLPGCRGGSNVTPTDVLHHTGEFIKWDREKGDEIIRAKAKEAGLDEALYIEKAKNAVSEMILHNLEAYKNLGFPLCAIGAPAQSWYHIAKRAKDFELVVPEHYEVANAVGAATAGTFTEVEGVVRPGEVGTGFLAHTKKNRYSFDDKKAAINAALKDAADEAKGAIRIQKLALAEVNYMCVSMYSSRNGILYVEHDVNEYGEVVCIEEKSDGYKYIETHVKVIASGKIFA